MTPHNTLDFQAKTKDKDLYTEMKFLKNIHVLEI